MPTLIYAIGSLRHILGAAGCRRGSMANFRRFIVGRIDLSHSWINKLTSRRPEPQVIYLARNAAAFA